MKNVLIKKSTVCLTNKQTNIQFKKVLQFAKKMSSIHIVAIDIAVILLTTLSHLFFFICPF